jgi:hypothetical protein
VADPATDVRNGHQQRSKGVSSKRYTLPRRGRAFMTDCTGFSHSVPDSPAHPGKTGHFSFQNRPHTTKLSQYQTVGGEFGGPERESSRWFAGRGYLVRMQMPPGVEIALVSDDELLNGGVAAGRGLSSSQHAGYPRDDFRAEACRRAPLRQRLRARVASPRLHQRGVAIACKNFALARSFGT